ncbi:hypothetical protein JCM8097_009327 [Rhodosporidiobolus ruineniae]
MSDAEKGGKEVVTAVVVSTLDSEDQERRDAALGHLQRKLSSRQVSMISIAGTIGTGLFLGTGGALATGGPGSLVINYTLVGALMLILIRCVQELVTQFPIAGAWPAYFARFVDEPSSFAFGWLTVFGNAITLGGDLAATVLLMQFWTDHLTWLPALFFMVGLLATQLTTVKAFGELEYWLSLLKVVSIVIFFFLGIAVNAGANTSNEYIGARNWTYGQAPFVGGFGGFASLFVKAAYAYGGVDSVAFAAAEAKNPTRNIRRIANRTLWRVLIFYISTTVLIGFNIRTAATSPFTLVFNLAGARAGGSFMNATILTSVLSACNMGCYSASRALYGMALRGHAPLFFSRLTRHGVPWAALLLVTLFSYVAFGLSFLPGGASAVWSYAQSLVGVNNQLQWLFIGIASWRMRSAWVKQGKSLSELKAPNSGGNWASRIIVVAFFFIVLIQRLSTATLAASTRRISSRLELPILLILYLGFRFIKGSRTPSLLEIDLVSGQYQDTEADEENNLEIARREKGRFGLFWRVYGWVA